jgi:hypothetical protein
MLVAQFISLEITMRAIFASVVFIGALVGCGGRAIRVESAPVVAPSITLTVTNGLAQAVNVYIVSGGLDRFLQQVAANSTAALRVAGLTIGASVGLKATTADGTKTYTKDGVSLQAGNTWAVP